jgi:hypothetical protein
LSFAGAVDADVAEHANAELHGFLCLGTKVKEDVGRRFL